MPLSSISQIAAEFSSFEISLAKRAALSSSAILSFGAESRLESAFAKSLLEKLFTITLEVSCSSKIPRSVKRFIFPSLTANAGTETKIDDINDDYHTGYVQLEQRIIYNPNDIAIIKSTILELVNNYFWMFQYDFRRLFYNFLK